MKSMKMMFVFVLAAALLLAMAGCHAQAPAPDAEPQAATTEASPTEEPTAPVNLTENGVTLVNAKGDLMTVYPQEDGTWLDAESKAYTFNGTDAWLDEGGAEWNLPAEDVPSEPANLTENPLKLVNAKGDFVTVYPQADGTWLDAESNVYTFDGADAWLDEGGAEWNLPAEDVPAEPANLTENPLKLVNAKGDFVIVYPQADGTWLDADSNVYTFDGAEDWTTADGQVWNRALETLVLVNAKGDYLGVSNDGGTYTDAKGNALTFDGSETWRDKNGLEWNRAALVELVDMKGDNTNVFLQEDGTYADGEGKAFFFDGADTWMDASGAEWAFVLN